MYFLPSLESRWLLDEVHDCIVNTLNALCGETSANNWNNIPVVV